MSKLTKKDFTVLQELMKEWKIIPWQGDCDKALLWAQDLETTEFEQGNNMLRKGNRLCCLGIACNTYKENTKSVEEWDRKGESIIYSFSGEVHILPPVVVDWFSLPESEENPFILVDKTTGSDSKRAFAYLNDTLQLTFQQIAWIVRESVRLAKKNHSDDIKGDVR